MKLYLAVKASMKFRSFQTRSLMKRLDSSVIDLGQIPAEQRVDTALARGGHNAIEAQPFGDEFVDSVPGLGVVQHPARDALHAFRGVQFALAALSSSASSGAVSQMK